MTRLFMKSLQCELDLQKLSRNQSDTNQKEEGKYRFVKYVYITFHCLRCNRIRMQILYLLSSSLLVPDLRHLLHRLLFSLLSD